MHDCVWDRHPSPVLLSLEIFAACLGAFAAGDRADRAKEEPQNGLKFSSNGASSSSSSFSLAASSPAPAPPSPSSPPTSCSSASGSSSTLSASASPNAAAFSSPPLLMCGQQRGGRRTQRALTAQRPRKELERRSEGRGPIEPNGSSTCSSSGQCGVGGAEPGSSEYTGAEPPTIRRAGGANHTR